jgi:site-specific DNA-methyltransferase (adenine-specific)/site-specific DNA-methyltransferase (cytosine-N4-specific)
MILEGDCFELIKTLEDNSVDLVITSPPYADIVNYGVNVSIKKPKEYCDWLLPLFDEIYRVLKPSGSFILNINDNCSNGLRNPFIYELIYRSQKETKLRFYDTYIWHKKNGIPNGGTKRFRNNTEFIFHFVKNQKELKFYMDRVLQEPAESSNERYKYDMTNHGVIVDGVREKSVKIRPQLGLVRPDNVFRFPTAATDRSNLIRHPAPFNRKLPEYFINLLTDEGDVVLDVFAGIGTTGLPCKDMNRHFIGFELNSKYVDFGNKRIAGEELEEWLVCQYDLDDNLIACYKNRMEASKATGVNEVDIMRTYNRTKFESRGGFKWKLERKYVINQYDLNDNFIKSWNTITEIENELAFDSHNHIEDCIRKGNKTSYGYKWKLEKKYEDTSN